MKRFTLLPLFAVIGLSLGCPKAPKPVATEPTIDSRNSIYKPGAGVVTNTLNARKRMVATNDFDQLRLFIYSYELDNNRMPTKEEIRAELKNAANLLKLIDEGAILLPTPLQKQGVWAYEVDSDKVGGIVIVAGDVKINVPADEVKKLLGQK